MDILRVSLVTVLMLLAPIALFPQSTSGEDAHQVYMHITDAVYDVGESVPINATVLNNSQLHDPPEIYLSIGQVDESSRRVNMTRIATGRYTANLTVQMEDINKVGVVRFAVVAVFEDGTTVSDGSHFYSTLHNSLRADIVLTDPKDDVVEFGDDIDFMVKVSFKGEPVDPDEGSFKLVGYEAVRPSYYVGSSVNLSRVSTGLYNGTFHIPGDRNESAHFKLSCRANYTTDGRTWRLEGYSSYERHLYVNLFNIWAETADVTRESADLTLFVTDLEGNASSDAVVSFNLTYRPAEGPTVVEPMSGSTSDAGLAEFTLSYAGLDNGSTWVDVDDGLVKLDGFVQHFDGRVHVPEWNGTSPPTVSSYTTIEVESPVEPGADVPVGILFVTDNKPEEGRQVFVVVRTLEEVIHTLEMVTGVDGWANFSFEAPELEPSDGPSLRVWIEWSYWVENPWGDDRLNSRGWSIYVGEEPVEHYYTPWLDPETTLNVDEFPPYGPVDVEMDNPDADGLAEIAILLWAVGRMDDYVDDDFYPGYQRWSPGSEFMGRDLIGRLNPVKATWDGEAYRASFNLPPHLPADVEIFVYGAIEFIDSPTEDIRAALLEGLTATLPHARPTVTVDFPPEHGSYNHTLNASGTASSVTSVERVEVKVDLGPWTVADGTDEWNLSLDLSDLSGWDHILSVRAFDGELYSRVVTVPFHTGSRPFLDILLPRAMSFHMGNVSVSGWAMDDQGVTFVEVRLRGGDWLATLGADQWSIIVDVSDLPYGTCLVEARAFDGQLYSYIASVTIVLDDRPTVEILSPLNGAIVNGTIVVRATAQDRLEVKAVEVRVDGGPWSTMMGTLEWSKGYDTTNLEFGEHSIEVRAFDGRWYSQVAAHTITVDQPPELTVEKPDEGDVYSDDLLLWGMLTDDGDSALLFHRLNGGEWESNHAIYDWYVPIDIEELGTGDHVFEVRASDGQSDTPIISRNFSIDMQPVIAFTGPSMPLLTDTPQFISGIATDDIGVVQVDVRYDNSDWMVATGTTVWNFSMDGHFLTSGLHSIEARAFDGRSYSMVARITIVVDRIPFVVISYPVNGMSYGPTILATGQATDDLHIIDSVLVRIDGGEWTAVDCVIGRWTMDLSLEEGEHTIEAMCSDGNHESMVMSLTFTVVDPPSGSNEPTFTVSGPFYILIGVLVLVTLFVIFRSWKTRQGSA